TIGRFGRSGKGMDSLVMSIRSVAVVLCLSILFVGCAKLDPPARAPAVSAPIPSEPVGVQLLRVEPSLRNQRFNALLTFESPADAVFVEASTGRVAVDSTRAHTGRSSLTLSPEVTQLDVKLDALLRGRAFPG